MTLPRRRMPSTRSKAAKAKEVKEPSTSEPEEAMLSESETPKETLTKSITEACVSSSSSSSSQPLSDEPMSVELVSPTLLSSEDDLLVFETQTVRVEEDEHGDTIITTVHESSSPLKAAVNLVTPVDQQSEHGAQYESKRESADSLVRVERVAESEQRDQVTEDVQQEHEVDHPEAQSVASFVGSNEAMDESTHSAKPITIQLSTRASESSQSSSAQVPQSSCATCSFRPILTVIVGRGIKRETSDDEDEEAEEEEEDNEHEEEDEVEDSMLFTPVPLSLESSLNKSKEKYVEYDCPKCPFFALTQDEVDEHIAQSHKALAKKRNAPPKERVKCELCEKTFVRKYELQTHVKLVHLNMREFKCPDCDYCSADKGRISKHRRTVHLKERHYPCPYCSYKSASKSGVDAHVKARHTMERAWKCEHCDKRFVQKGQMVKHVQAVHLKLKKASCPYEGCDYKGLDEAAVKNHVKIRHIKEKNHLCQECGYTTSTRSQLNSHIQKKHVNKKRRKTKSILVEGYKFKQPLHMFAV